MSSRIGTGLVVSASSVVATPSVKPISAIWCGLRSVSIGLPAKKSTKPVAASCALSSRVPSMLPEWSKTREVSIGTEHCSGSPSANARSTRPGSSPAGKAAPPPVRLPAPHRLPHRGHTPRAPCPRRASEQSRALPRCHASPCGSRDPRWLRRCHPKACGNKDRPFAAGIPGDSTRLMAHCQLTSHAKIDHAARVRRRGLKISADPVVCGCSVYGSVPNSDNATSASFRSQYSSPSRS